MVISRISIPECLANVYYLSDTHLEESVKKQIPLPTKESVGDSGKTLMGLLGDIGWFQEDSYWELVLDCLERFDYVVLILGNHEYHHEILQEVPMKMRQTLEKRRQCHPSLERAYFLENAVLEFENIRLFGSTFWTKPTHTVFMRLNDRKYIQDNTYSNKVLSIQTIYDLNDRAFECLKEELDASTKPLIVLSHHAPLPECNGIGFENSQYTSAFINHAEEFMKPPMVAWLYGHTHQNMSFVKNGIYIGTNAWGYDKERMRAPYELGKAYKGGVVGFSL
jgi:predicted phosphodiesterase